MKVSNFCVTLDFNISGIDFTVTDKKHSVSHDCKTTVLHRRNSRSDVEIGF